MAGLAIAEALHVSVLVDPAVHMHGGTVADVVGVGLLVADVLLPVPSRAVMVAHGASLGVGGDG